MASISKDANAVLSGVSPEAKAYAIANTQGNKLTSGEASRLTSEFLSANSGAANQVYSSNNIAQTTTAPVAAPNLSDPFGLYNYYMNTPDITAAKEGAKTAQAQLLERTKAARDQQQQLGQNLQSTNRIRGSQQNAQQLATNDIQALNEAYTLAASNVDALTSTAKEKMAIAEQSRNEIKSLIASTGGKAGISYADTYESAVAKAKKYDDKVAKDAKKEAEKSALKEMALTAGIKTKGKSSSEIRKAIEKAAKKDRGIKDELDQLKIQSAKADIAKTLSGGGLSTTDIKSANENYIYNSLSTAQRGKDGFIDPSVWKPALKEWQDAGGTTSEFITKFGGKVNEKGKRTEGFINPFDL
jgi:hypothetical protein